MASDEIHDEENKEPIIRFRGEHFFLSNFYSDTPMPLSIEDENGKTYNLTFSNTESMFQGFKVFKDVFGKHTHEEIEKFKAFSALSAKDARQAGRRVSPFDGSYWDSVKDRVMEKCLAIKFSNPDLRAKLLATGDRALVEGNSYGDTYWGMNLVADANSNAIGVDNGNNKLGSLLMNERQRILEMSKKPLSKENVSQEERPAVSEEDNATKKDNLVVVITTRDRIRVEAVDFDSPIDIMRPIGGGMMNRVKPAGLRDSELVMLVDDNGFNKGLKENRIGTSLYRRTIVGDILICPEVFGYDGPELVGFSPEMAEKFVMMIMEKAPYLERDSSGFQNAQDSPSKQDPHPQAIEKPAFPAKENQKKTEREGNMNKANYTTKYSFRDTGKYFTVVSPSPDSVTPEQKETFSAIIKAFSDLGYTPRINSSKNNEGLIPKGVNYVLVGKKTQMTKEALSSLDKYSPESDEIHRQSCAEKHMAIMGDGKSARSDFVLICSSEGKLGPALHTAIIAEDPAVNIPVFDIGRKDKAGVLIDYQALRDAFSNVKRGASVIDAIRRQNTGLHIGPEKVYSRYVNPEVASEKQNDRAFENMSRSALWNHVFRESSLHPVHGSSPVHEREKNPYSLDTTDPTVSVNEWTFQMPEDDNSVALESEIVVPSRVKITELPRNQYVWLPDTDDDLIELNADMNYAEDGVSRNTDVVALADVTEYETLTTRGQLEAYMETLNVDRDGISNDTVARFFSPIDRRNENGDRFYSHEELIAMEIMNDGDTWSNIKKEYFGNDFGNENSAREYSESENIIEM